jgi:hypothetical protein
MFLILKPVKPELPDAGIQILNVRLQKGQVSRARAASTCTQWHCCTLYSIMLAALTWRTEMALTHIFVSVSTQRSEIIELPADE